MTMWSQDISQSAPILDALPHGLLLLDESGLLLFANAAARLMTGREWPEGEPAFPERPEMSGDGADGPVFFEMTVPNGKKLLALATEAHSAGDGRVRLVVLHDRADLHQLIDRINLISRDTQALEAIISSTHDGLWLMDHTGRVILVNQGTERIHQLKKDEVIGKTLDELTEMQIMDRSVTLEVLRHKTSLTITQQMPRLGKEILVSANPVFDEKGEVRFVVVTDRDMTELNRLRRELEETQRINRRFRSKLPVSLQSDSLAENGVVNSEAMKKVYRQAIKAAGTDSTILIMGESGSGKGFLVKQIHEASSRSQGPLIHLDCGAVPESLIDSELFGYESGAFTGARREGKPGFLEAADGGTLFLDEISELPVNAQVKLLRFLDGNEFIRVGGIATRRSNVRIVAATNRNLEKMVKAGQFRKDLYYRLNVVPITIPPLRERTEAVPRLISYFLQLMNAKNSTEKVIDQKAMEYLCRYSYPGNVRELINLVEQLVVLSTNQCIMADDLPQHVLVEVSPLAAWTGTKGWNLKKAVNELEREMLLQALNRFNSQKEAALYLGLDQSTLTRKLQKHGIRWKLILHRDI